jgi:hypothetical protein
MTEIFQDLLNSPFLNNVEYVELNQALFRIVKDLDRVLPQLHNFIVQFDTFVQQSNINVITDAQGNMSIDVPSSMSDQLAQKASTKINVLDRLISSQKEKCDELLKEGFNLERAIKRIDTKSESRLNVRNGILKDLCNAHKH